jgi:SAM-dependent methyltransferase
VAGSLYTTSLISSVLNYKYENGRRYHAYREGNYVLPNDEQEQERLDMLHHIFRMITGGPIFRAPLFGHTRPQRVLDMGCGTGIWTIEFSDEWPEATVIGTDLSPIQPSWVPPNCKFYVDDIEGEWTYPPAEHFDYIHGRALLGSIAGWKELFSKAFNHLKPGGILEIQDFPSEARSDDDGLRHVPYLADWLQKLNDGLLKIGKPSRIVHLLKGYMEEAGFVDVHEEICKVRYCSTICSVLLNSVRSQSVLGQKDVGPKNLGYSSKRIAWIPSNLSPWLYSPEYWATVPTMHTRLLHKYRMIYEIPGRIFMCLFTLYGGENQGDDILLDEVEQICRRRPPHSSRADDDNMPYAICPGDFTRCLCPWGTKQQQAQGAVRSFL